MDICCVTYFERCSIQTATLVARRHNPHYGCERYTSAADTGTRPGRSEAHQTDVCRSYGASWSSTQAERAMGIYQGHGSCDIALALAFTLGFCIYMRWEMAPAFEVLDAHLVLYQYRIRINLNIMIVSSLRLCSSVVGVCVVCCSREVEILSHTFDKICTLSLHI